MGSPWLRSRCTNVECPSQRYRGVRRAPSDWNIRCVRPFSCHQFFKQTYALCLISTSALTPQHWRDQRTVVQSLSRATPLSNFTVPSGISGLPHCAQGGGGPSPYIPRLTSLAFHPMEMLYGVGGPDGTGKLRHSKIAIVR